MSIIAKSLALTTLGILLIGGNGESAAEPRSKVSVESTQSGGIQPQAAVDTKGTIHLVYFKGEPGAGDLFYVHREAGGDRFSEPIRVNSEANSAIATGSVRGGQIAVGKNGRVHVAWNGSGKPKEAMFYARLNDAGTAFEKQRDLIGGTAIMDGGGTVAADDAGNVYVVWHALKAGGERGEGNRRVWVAQSGDEGKTFRKEHAAWDESTGVCGCCSTRAFADSGGTVYMLYRSAGAGVNRDIYVLTSEDHGKHFEGALIHKWKVPA